jgi:hypothetical protein
MKIETTIRVHDRKSLQALKAYALKRRDDKKKEMVDSYQYARKRWSPKRVAGDFLKNTALPFFIHGAFDIVRAVGNRDENETAQSWIDLVENLVESYLSTKADEIIDEE